MVGWIILGVIVLIITGINLIRVGVDAAYEGGVFSLSAKVAGVMLKLLPKEEQGEPKEKKEKKPKKKKKKKKKEEPDQEQSGEKKKKGLPLGMNREELIDLIKGVLRLLGRFPGKFVVDRFRLHLTVAWWDPYDSAMLYGYVNEALSILLPIARENIRVRQSDVRTELDFNSDKMLFEGALGFSIRIGQIVGLVFAIGFHGLKIVLRSKRRQKKERKAAGTAGSEAQQPEQTGLPEHKEETGVSDIDKEKENNDKDTTEAEERMASNG